MIVYQAYLSFPNSKQESIQIGLFSPRELAEKAAESYENFTKNSVLNIVTQKVMFDENNLRLIEALMLLEKGKKIQYIGQDGKPETSEENNSGFWFFHTDEREGLSYFVAKDNDDTYYVDSEITIDNINMFKGKYRVVK
jgi:hypothetical protein